MSFTQRTKPTTVGVARWDTIGMINETSIRADGTVASAKVLAGLYQCANCGAETEEVQWRFGEDGALHPWCLKCAAPAEEPDRGAVGLVPSSIVRFPEGRFGSGEWLSMGFTVGPSGRILCNGCGKPCRELQGTEVVEATTAGNAPVVVRAQEQPHEFVALCEECRGGPGV